MRMPCEGKSNSDVGQCHEDKNGPPDGLHGGREVKTKSRLWQAVQAPFHEGGSAVGCNNDNSPSNTAGRMVSPSEIGQRSKLHNKG